MADGLHLPRIKNNSELKELIDDGELVPITAGPDLHIAFPRNRAYLRPWAAEALSDLSRDFYSTFGQPLWVDSAVRTVQFQHRLRRWNRNAAPASGPTASVHPAGIAFDLKRRGLTMLQVRWLEWRLLVWALGGLVTVEEENRHSCVHVVVSGAYGPTRPQIDPIPSPLPTGLLAPDPGAAPDTQ